MADFSGNRLEGDLREWSEVNRQLRRQGFQAVRILPATEVPVHTGRYVCLDPDSNEILRQNLLSLLADCEHRQTLVHDLMEANKLLKVEISALTEKAEKLQAKSKDLKIMLECSRKRVKELEEEKDMPVHHFSIGNEQGHSLRDAIGKRCKMLEEGFAEKEIENDKLKKKLRVIKEEEEKRISRQNQVFQEFKKRTSRVHSLMDSKLLDIIDMYEGQLYELKQELELAKRGESRLHGQEAINGPSAFSLEPTKNAKNIIKSLDRQLKEADRKMKELENEKDLMALDMEARPQLLDHRLACQRVKKLERLLALHNISIPGEKSARDPFKARRKYSTKLEDLPSLPVDICQQYLKELCSEMGVEDVQNLVPAIQQISKRLEQANQYQEFCLDMQQTVDRMHDPSRAGRPRRISVVTDGGGALSESSIKHSLGVIEGWRQDVTQLQELQESLNRLLEKVVPRAKIHFTASHSVSDMTTSIDNLADDESTVVTQEGYEHISRSTLEKIVRHFQTLFDVPSVNGILTCMTDIYQRFGEGQNVLNTLRNLLGLASDTGTAAVVDAVGRLCQAHNSTTTQQLQQLFETDDLASVIRRLDEHGRFFPAFKETMCKLLEILGLERMDQVIPAVRALKMLAS